MPSSPALRIPASTIWILSSTVPFLSARDARSSTRWRSLASTPRPGGSPRTRWAQQQLADREQPARECRLTDRGNAAGCYCGHWAELFQKGKVYSDRTWFTHRCGGETPAQTDIKHSTMEWTNNITIIHRRCFQVVETFSQLCHINRNIKHLNFVPNFKLNHSKLTKSSHVCHSSHKAELRSQRHFFHKVKIYVVLNNGCTTGFLSRKGNIFWRKCKNARLQWKLQRIDFKMLKCLSFRNDLSVSNRWTQRN